MYFDMDTSHLNTNFPHHHKTHSLLLLSSKLHTFTIFYTKVSYPLKNLTLSGFKVFLINFKTDFEVVAIVFQTLIT